ncbi:MAG: phosphopantetheine adenylyltransferase [Candidatus Bathyarchaeia archaeon]
MRKYRRVAVGGTFDELHKGHKALLTKAFEIGEHVAIGLCSDEFVAKLSKPHATAPYSERLKELKTFLSDLGVSERAEIVPLNDPFGTTLKAGCLEALVVSEETMPMATKINQKRYEMGLQPLKVIAIKMVPSENCAPISTTRIRRGEIDREGHLLKSSR